MLQVGAFSESMDHMFILLITFNQDITGWNTKDGGGTFEDMFGSDSKFAVCTRVNPRRRLRAMRVAVHVVTNGIGRQKLACARVQYSVKYRRSKNLRGLSPCKTSLCRRQAF